MSVVNLADHRPASSRGQDPAAPPVVLRGPVRDDLIRDEVLSEIISATAGRHPDRLALVFEGLRLTYAEVIARADAIARGLIRRGIGPGQAVGLWMPRGAELLISQIAITRTGAAWLPFDAEAPVDRIAVCLDDADAAALLTSPEFATRLDLARPVLTPAALTDAADETPIPPRAPGLTPDHSAYMIYTSGSTGVPKGIVISQRNICHFLRSANETYGFQADDVVFQGASVAFDLSMEEIWVPYLVGATLFVGTPAMLGDAETLPDLLIEAGVTVLDTVPTLLAMLTRDVPALRIIICGGEALPAPLVARWATPGRRLFNTYGPTEATVVATAAEAVPGEIVTIGQPIANYTCYVADENLNALPAGVQGELLIGGPGVAQGYLKRPELTAEKFVANPFGGDGRDPILYRSGDAVSVDEGGNILFHGRIDDQVKIRGFRVELGEIEAKLAELPGIAQATVVLRQDDGIDRLVAFLVMEAGQALDRARLRADLRENLPPYMVPSHFEALESLPRLSSGKADRKALRAMPLAVAEGAGEQEDPANETEAALLVAAKRVFGNQPIPFESDFFTDLGGHSLLAARFVSAVREAPALAGITLQDVYERRSLRAMADRLIERTGGAGAETVIRDLSFEPPPLMRRFFCGLAQALSMVVVLTFATVQWLGVLLTYLLIAGEGLGVWGEIGAVLFVAMLINVSLSLIAVAGKWLILGRTKPGRYPLWGVYYFRWWLARRFTSLVPIPMLQGSPALPLYLRILGAKVGRDVIMGDVDIGAIDLVSIGDGTTIGSKVGLSNVEVIGNEFVIGEIAIGSDVSIGTSCVISAGARIGDHAEIADLTMIPEDTAVAPAERWDGSPGRPVGKVDLAALPKAAETTPQWRLALTGIYGVMLLVIPLISLLPIFPAFYVFNRIDDFIFSHFEISYYWYLPLVAWVMAMAMTTVTSLIIVALRWSVLPRVRAGTYSIFSLFYIRKWIVSFSTEAMLDTLTALYATVYMRGWYRLMGARIGKGAEISTNLAGRYDLCAIGDHNFIADEVQFGDEEVRRGWMRLEHAETGDRVFVGNSAVVPPGAVIPENTLIGIKSKPPANERMAPGETWFGSPPIKLPTRQKVDMGANWTFEPTFRMKLGRALFEALRVSFPTMLVITIGFIVVDNLFFPQAMARDWGGLAISLVVASALIPMVETLLVVIMKWLMMGTYKPLMKPMWSWWALRTEAIGVLYWGLAGKALLEHSTGTPFLPWMLRLFGCKFGKGVCLHTTDMTEFDCVTVGDFCTINALSGLQTHLFEDRVMKVGRIELGKGVTVGSFATVLYDTKVGDYAVLKPLTIVMKGESIPGHSEWEGAPAVPVIHTPPEAKAAA